MTNARRGDYYNCYKFNAGNKDSVLTSTKFGKYTGLTLNLTLSKSEIMFYYIGDSQVRPVFSEFTNFLQTGKTVYVGIKKTVDTKLPEPYNQCIQSNSINTETSNLVKQVLEQNITYRKINCYDLCIQEYALGKNVSLDRVYREGKFSYEDECSGRCPSECTSSIYDFDQNEIVYENSTYLKVNFHNVEPKYTELTQLRKITEADLISNTGGILGLFLDISFYHIYKFLDFLFRLAFTC